MNKILARRTDAADQPRTISNSTFGMVLL